MKALKNVLELYYVMFMLNSNEPIKVAHLQKDSQSINVEWHTYERQFFQWKLEKLWSFNKSSKVLSEKEIKI